MTIGSLEAVVVGFDGGAFIRGFAQELVRLQRCDAVRIIDLVFVARDAAGVISSTETEALESGAEQGGGYGAISCDLRRLLTDDDIANITLELPANSTALILLIGHAWPEELQRAVERAGGIMLGNERISPDVIDELGGELSEPANKTDVERKAAKNYIGVGRRRIGRPLIRTTIMRSGVHPKRSAD